MNTQDGNSSGTMITFVWHEGSIWISRRLAQSFAVALLLLLGADSVWAQPSFVTFESGHVRPVALSPDGATLFAVNTPDNTLEIFDVDAAGLAWRASVPVGMEPVAVAARTDDEVWVVNHLSDSVSIVDLAGSLPFVTRTLLVGDEPRDIVFAGTGGSRAFIATARRGQHRTHPSIAGVFGPGEADPRFTSVSDRADVWVFDAGSLGDTLGGTPVDVLTFFSDTPRALATDGSTVYVAAFRSGNQTTVINHRSIPDGFDSAAPTATAPGGLLGPDDNAFGDPAPETSLIVKWWNGGGPVEAWRDALGRNWNGVATWRLPDNDVFAFDADTLAKGTIFQSVGTVLFNMAVNPSSGKVYVTNTESPNLTSFEGPGVYGGSTVQGHLSEARVTVLDPVGPSLDVQHLNQHIDYGMLHTDAGADHAAIDAQIPHSLATPLLPAISSDGADVYIPAFGSAKIGVFTRLELEDPDFETAYDPTAGSADDIATEGGGPSGIALDETNDRLYVLTRFDNAVEVIDLATKTTSAVHPLHNPEPPEVVDGRPFLYDATISSGNGEASCASCHIFGDNDSLSWNLGNPDAATSTNNQPSATPQLPAATTFHPMKGPMSTQTLRGLATHGAMHWRGDRLDGFFGTDPCTEPGSFVEPGTNAPCDEDHAFRNFIVAFEGLVGKQGTLTPQEMQQFSDFALRVMLPPNPARNFDNSLTAQQQLGEDTYFGCGPGTTECGPNNPGRADAAEDCDGCHNLDPINGLIGSGGGMGIAAIEADPQDFKIPHLRNMYTKVGMFKLPVDVVRGTGFAHDGSIATLFEFFSLFPLLNFQERRALEQFLLVFPSDLAPIVGQQVTIGPGNFDVADVHDRIDLLDARAGTPFDSLLLGGSVTECDVVVKTVEGGAERGWVRQADGSYLPDDSGPALSEAALREKANPLGEARTLTYTAAPPGSGSRMGIDRDEDLVSNGLDNCPAWPNGPGLGTCTEGDPALLTSTCAASAECGEGGFCSLAQEDDDGDGTGDVCELIALPEPGAALQLAAGCVVLAALARTRRQRRRGL